MSSKDSSCEFEKTIVLSDLHGVFVDPGAFSCVLQVVSEHPHDRLIINGDLLDLPKMMAEGKHKLSPDADEITLVEEIEFIVENILQHLRKANKKVEFVFKPGNHEDRLFRMGRDGFVTIVEFRYSG